MGQLAGRRRSLGVAVFFTAGMVGGVSGSLFAPWYNHRFGLTSMVWTIAPGLLFAVLLAWAIHSIPHRTHDAHESHRALSPRDRALRWRAVGLLYVGNAMRFTVNMALAHLVVRWAEDRTLARAGAEVLSTALRADAATRSGPHQAAMQVGMGLSGLVLGFLISHKHEKRTLVLVPALGATAVAALPYSSGLWAYLLVALCGVGFAGVIPMTIAMAQRLLPHRTSLASGLMMGGAWAVAGIGPPNAQKLHDAAGLESAFLVVAGLLLLAGLASAALPAATLRQVAR
jgi:MFS family permease